MPATTATTEWRDGVLDERPIEIRNIDNGWWQVRERDSMRYVESRTRDGAFANLRTARKARERDLVADAAPEMLAALKLTEPVCEDAVYDARLAGEKQNEQAAQAAWDAVRVAIAKAEGRS